MKADKDLTTWTNQELKIKALELATQTTPPGISNIDGIVAAAQKYLDFLTNDSSQAAKQ